MTRSSRESTSRRRSSPAIIRIALAVGALLYAASFPAEAQHDVKVYGIGVLEIVAAASSNVNLSAFRQGLRELGYVEGQNFVIEYRSADGRPERFADLASYRLREFVDVGGLMSYGTDRRDLFRRSAVYVHQILKGARPADLPVEPPTKFELAINLKTAKALGLTIPPALLQRADYLVQ